MTTALQHGYLCTVTSTIVHDSHNTYQDIPRQWLVQPPITPGTSQSSVKKNVCSVGHKKNYLNRTYCPASNTLAFNSLILSDSPPLASAARAESHAKPTFVLSPVKIPVDVTRPQ